MIRTLAVVSVLAVSSSGCGRTDEAIASESRQRLAADAALQGASISVTVKKGIVLLRGHTADDRQSAEATARVAEVDGVQRVISQLTLRDDSIRSEVLDALRREPRLQGVTIDVEVADGVVRLHSAATNADQRAAAVAAARAVPGVVHVDDAMK